MPYNASERSIKQSCYQQKTLSYRLPVRSGAMLKRRFFFPQTGRCRSPTTYQIIVRLFTPMLPCVKTPRKDRGVLFAPPLAELISEIEILSQRIGSRQFLILIPIRNIFMFLRKRPLKHLPTIATTGTPPQAFLNLFFWNNL